MTEEAKVEVAEAAKPALLTNTISPRIVILNGPPRSGKSTAVEAIITAYSQAVHCQFAAPLKAAAACLLSMSILELEAKKEEQIELPGLEGELTHRQFLINLSEDFTKVNLGEQAFGHIATRGIKRVNAQSPAHWLYLFSDGGFEQEFLPLIEAFGADNILIIQIFRQGCSFKSDSRSYIDLTDKGISLVTLNNDGDVADLISNAGKIIEDWALVSMGSKANGSTSESSS